MGDGRNGANPAAAGPESPFLGRATPGAATEGRKTGGLAMARGIQVMEEKGVGCAISIGGLGHTARKEWARPGNVAAWCSPEDGYDGVHGIPSCVGCPSGPPWFESMRRWLEVVLAWVVGRWSGSVFEPGSRADRPHLAALRYCRDPCGHASFSGAVGPTSLLQGRAPRADAETSTTSQ